MRWDTIQDRSARGERVWGLVVPEEAEAELPWVAENNTQGCIAERTRLGRMQGMPTREKEREAPELLWEGVVILREPVAGWLHSIEECKLEDRMTNKEPGMWGQGAEVG